MAGDHDEEELVGLVPGSFKQALDMAAARILENPEEKIVIKRGAKVLDRVDEASLARRASGKHADKERAA